MTNKFKYAYWLQICSLFLYSVLGFAVIRFPRDMWQGLTLFLGCVVLDMLLHKLIFKSYRTVYSSLIAAFGLFMFLESFTFLPYVVGFLAAISSKYIFRYKNQPVFNPSNFGICMVVLFMSQDVATVPVQWGGSIYFVAAILILGGTCSYLVGRLPMSLAYIFGVFALYASVGYFYGVSPLYALGTSFSIPLLIYAFHMITDPRTSPNGPLRWVYVGVAIVLEVILRLNHVIYASLFTLLFITGVMPAIDMVYDYVKSRKAQTAVIPAKEFSA